MDKYDLLLNATSGNDKERLKRLFEFDSSVGGMKLYRYRPLDETRAYELEALESCKIWASNPNLLDDDYELTASGSSYDDYKFVEYFVKRNALKQHRYPYQDLATIRKASRTDITRIANYELKKHREHYAISCFTENSPIGDSSMWDQYANGRGICIEYSLLSFVEAKMIIDPVYYLKEKTLGNIFRTFGENESAMLMICVKDKYGKDKYSGSNIIIDWEQQKEWRYLLYNKKSGIGKYLNGLYSNRPMKPDAIYTKGLDQSWIQKVKATANINDIPVIVIDSSKVQKIVDLFKKF